MMRALRNILAWLPAIGVLFCALWYLSSTRPDVVAFMQDSLLSTPLCEAATAVMSTAAAAAAVVGSFCVQQTSRSYDWLSAHPYPAVIGGMVLYMLVLMAVSTYMDKGRMGQSEQLKRQFEQYQRFQHYMRLQRWQQQHPEQAAQRAQQQQQQQQPARWAGMMGFGEQPVPKGCAGPVKEVLLAMDFYEVLGVPWDKVTARGLRAARKAKALAVHPDKTGQNTAGADLAVSRVNMAYDTLIDAKLRQEYDQWLSKQC